MSTAHATVIERRPLRFSVSGNVDDGKSTLVGRLLLDTKQIADDQLEHVEEASRRRGFSRTELALLTDGLRAEREQGITIDVAYRYFRTAKRRFIVADTPGHVQYTRNMITGASTADVALLIVDARHGVTEQTRRHALASRLVGVKNIVFGVNKMDLVGFAEARFREVERDLEAFSARLPSTRITIVPVAALGGDNVVDRSTSMPWYTGPSLLELLEEAPVAQSTEAPFRFPVQWVIRPGSDAHHDYRAFSGQIAQGRVKVGDRLTAWPSGKSSTVVGIDRFPEELTEATAPLSVAIRLAEDVDVSRGDVLTHESSPPRVGRQLVATVAWFDARAVRPGARFWLKNHTKTVKARLDGIVGTLDLETLAVSPGAEELRLNDLAVVRLATSAPVVFDAYEDAATTGSFILVDEATHETVAAGLIRSESGEQA
jgi:sulfate adenylyltransferase large subunit